MRIKSVEIVKGWYWSAGKQYKWVDDGLDMDGIGLNKELFDSDQIHVTVKGKKYIVNTIEAKQFIDKYKSFSFIGGAKVGYISRSIMLETNETSTL